MSDLKSILLHVDGSARVALRVQVACRLAEAFDAHVTALYGCMPSLLRYPMAVEASAAAVSVMGELDDEVRATARSVFEAASAGSSRIEWAEPQGDALWGWSRRAFFCDLMVLGQRDPTDRAAAELPSDFLPSLLVDTGKPALLLPYAGTVATDAPIGGCVLVAWKESREAARAVSAAMPWLKRAAQVHLLGFGDGAETGLQWLAAYLARHGVQARLHGGGPEPAQPAEALLSSAADLGADLLVMGCYGHSRAREWVLGGVTRSILQSMTLPVLMVH
jgi:nucleotide-binding universal stress UspA family protein